MSVRTTIVTNEYNGAPQAFSKAKVSQLPPLRSSDCTIDFFFYAVPCHLEAECFSFQNLKE